MVLFNWKKIVKDTAGNKRDIFVIMRWLTFKVVPSNRKDPLYRYMSKNYEGDSFLVNAAPIFYEYKNYTTSETHTICNFLVSMLPGPDVMDLITCEHPK